MISSKIEFKRILKDNWCIIRCFLNISRKDNDVCIDCEDIDKNIIAIDISMSC